MATKKMIPKNPYTVVFYIDGDDAVETFMQEVMADSKEAAFAVAVAAAREDGGTTSGNQLYTSERETPNEDDMFEDDWDGATEIVTFFGHGLNQGK